MGLPTKSESTGRSRSSTRTREEARLSFKMWPSHPPWSGEHLWMPLRQLLNWRKLSIKVCWTCTRPLMETRTCVTTSSLSSWTSRWRHQGDLHLDHQDEESRTRTWIPHDRQGDRKLNISMFGKPIYSFIGSTFGIFNRFCFI